MYGRANFDLLRHRILLAAEPPRVITPQDLVPEPDSMITAGGAFAERLDGR